jgi:Leu/Phe-tRNA-protein transferase
MDYWLIDCQQRTKHLESLGGEFVSRTEFLKYMKKNNVEETARGSWKNLFT